MIVLKDIHPHPLDEENRLYQEEEAKPHAEKTVCVVRLVEAPGEIFTLVHYTGPHAREVCGSTIADFPIFTTFAQAFEKDFRKLSGVLCASPSRFCHHARLSRYYSSFSVSQIYGYNDVPSLVLHNGT